MEVVTLAWLDWMDTLSIDERIEQWGRVPYNDDDFINLADDINAIASARKTDSTDLLALQGN